MIESSSGSSGSILGSQVSARTLATRPLYPQPDLLPMYLVLPKKSFGAEDEFRGYVQKEKAYFSTAAVPYR